MGVDVAMTTPKTSSAFDAILSLTGVEENLWDALSEAALALAVFAIASIFLKMHRRHKAKSAKPSKQTYKHAEMSRLQKKSVAASRLQAAKDVQSAAQRESTGSVRNDEANTMPPRLPPGLHLKTSPNKQTDADLLASAIKAGKASQLPCLLDSAHRRAAIAVGNDQLALENATRDLLLVSLRACAASRCFGHGIAAYDHISDLIGVGSSELWSVLLYNIVEAGAFSRCKAVFERLCNLGSPSGHDLVNIVRCYSGKNDPSGLQEMVSSLLAAGHTIDAYNLNRALAACGNSTSAIDLAEILVSSRICAEGLDSVGYNTFMKYNAKFGRLARCFELRAEMLDKGLQLSEVTYGILLDACVRDGSKGIDYAKKVFTDLCSSGLQVNVVHCTTFLKGLVTTGRHDEAARVLREMSSSAGVKPDLITYSTLVKAYAERGNVASALKLLDEMIQEGIRPDDIMYNSVLNACNAFPLKSSDVMQTFDAIVGYGMVPTTTTLSILLKALMLSESYALALEVLENAVRKFNVTPEIRLYMQLTQACIKARKHRAAIEVFEAMLKVARKRGESIEPSALTRLLRSCALGGERSLAVEMQRLAQNSGVAVEPQAQKLLKAAMSKATKQG
jgi:pentatricopeptide repeat protein